MTKSLMLYLSFLFYNLIMINLFINLIPSYNKNIHPMIMGILLMLMIIFSSMIINKLNNYSFMSFIMFLIMIGAMMIIFLYFTSFINNMKMLIKWNYIVMMPIKMLTIMLMIMIFFLKKNFMLNYIKMIEFKSMNLINIMNNLNNNYNLSYIYIFNKNFITLISMIYLLLCLTFIVKMYINKKMSIRKMN